MLAGTNTVVGLLFAGATNGNLTFANHIGAVLRRLRVTLPAVLSVTAERFYGLAAEAGTALKGQVVIVAIDKGAYSFDDFSLAQGGK